MLPHHLLFHVPVAALLRKLGFSLRLLMGRQNAEDQEDPVVHVVLRLLSLGVGFKYGISV